MIIYGRKRNTTGCHRVTECTYRAFAYASSGLSRCVHGCLIFLEKTMKNKNLKPENSKKQFYFSKAEIILFLAAVIIIVTSFLLFDRRNYLTLCASLIGVTSIIFNAKGNPIGQLLMLAFSAVYGVISWSFAYYGEMMTYLGMTAPMAIVALVSWLRHPSGKRAEVKINKLKPSEYVLAFILTTAVTFGFYFILEYFDTANLVPSTISVATSFIAAYLTFRRSPFFSLAYAANDVVLIVLWSLAAAKDLSYVSVIACFSAFLLADVYGFINWKKLYVTQNPEHAPSESDENAA